MVVGSFHFDYPNLDAHKINKEDQIDVLSPKTAKEVTELVEYIKRFKPTKIAIEAWPSWNANQKLGEYNEGKHRDKRDERYQLAMRLASELKINELFSIDAESVLDDLEKHFGKTDSAFLKISVKIMISGVMTLSPNSLLLSTRVLSLKILNLFWTLLLI
ncbi:DUF5694 domain-containing protein [Chryseobacterium sp. 1B4]